jgi:hypothetical protein
MNFDGNYLLASFAVSLIGAGFFMYGKKQSRAPQMAFGVATAVYPYFISNPWLILGIFVLLLGLMYLALRLGW